MVCENNIINNDNDNQYNIDTKVLYKTKFKCSKDEPGDLPSYRHQNLKLSFDFNNYKLSQYINNNNELGLLDLYKKYVENFHTNLTRFKSLNKKTRKDDELNCYQSPDFYRTIEYLENQEEIYYLEEQIKNLIISLCYIRINDYIKKNYNTECYFIYNFDMLVKDNL